MEENINNITLSLSSDLLLNDSLLTYYLSIYSTSTWPSNMPLSLAYSLFLLLNNSCLLSYLNVGETWCEDELCYLLSYANTDISEFNLILNPNSEMISVSLMAFYSAVRLATIIECGLEL